MKRYKTSNKIMTCDFNKDGSIFAVPGQMPKISFYNPETLQIFREFSPQTYESELMHSNRIYSIIWDNTNSSIIFSGGWDNKVLMWDLRTSKAVRKFGGPIICGDSIDVSDSYLITGSFRPKSPIDIWDVGSGQIVHSCEWGTTTNCRVLALKVAKNTNLIAAGGADAQYGQLFSCPDLYQRGRLGTFLKEVVSVAVSDNGSIVLLSSEDGTCSAFLEKTPEKTVQKEI
jgi:WD40 repeat protein